MLQYKNVEDTLKYRSEEFKQTYGDSYVNPFMIPRYKELFRAFEEIVEYTDFRVEKKENGDPIIIIEPVDIEKYKKKYKELDDFPFGSDKNMMEFLNWIHDFGTEKINNVTKKIKKYNISYSPYAALPLVE